MRCKNGKQKFDYTALQKEEKKLQADAKKLAAQRLSAIGKEKALNAERKKIEAERKKLEQLSSVFDLEQIQIYAALQNKITDQEKLRLSLQLALIQGNASEAAKLAICLGPHTKYLCIDGSTSAKSRIFLASKSLAIVKPSVCEALKGF